MSAPEVAVVIVNYNTRDDTIACVESLLATTTAPAEVVVVDNGSVDGSVEALRRRFADDGADVTVVEAGANIGFAAGVNLGVANSSAPYVLLLNPDAIVLDGAVDALLSFAQAHPANGLYGGRTLRPDGGVDPRSCWGRMTLWSTVCFASGLSTAMKGSRLFDPEALGGWDRGTVREVAVITGCLLLSTRADWDRLGGMDERYFLYGEDADFSERACARGMRPIIVPDATIVHAVGGSTSSSGVKMSMVLAGKVTHMRVLWKPLAASTGVVLLQAGVGLRATLARLTRRTNGPWIDVWRRRADWRTGYPHAKSALFGIPAPTHVEV